MSRRDPGRGVSPLVLAAALALGAALLLPATSRGREGRSPGVPGACPPAAVAVPLR
jgi:hypothetical protein